MIRPVEPVRRGMASKTAWIWFAGATVWWMAAAVGVHYNHRANALLSLAVSALFFIAGMMWMKTPPKGRS